MAGQGPPPKDPTTRARRNKDGAATLTVDFVPAKQPKLPANTPWSLPSGTGRPKPVAWPPATKAWWKTWGESKWAEQFTANDWSELLDAAVLHAALWLGDTKAAAELRLRVAKFGATLEDRMRLRIHLAPKGEGDEETAKRSASRERFRDLRVVQGGQAAGG